MVSHEQLNMPLIFGHCSFVVLGKVQLPTLNLKVRKVTKVAGSLSLLVTVWGFMIPALMFGNVSGNHINPAFTLGLAVSGLFPWAQVAPYIVAQVLGAIFGQALVVVTHRPYYLKTENPNNILGTFSTISSLDNGSKESRFAATVNGFVNEFVGSFVLFFAALGLTKHFFGAELVSKAQAAINSQVAQATTQGQTIPQEQVTAALEQAKEQVAPFMTSGLGIAHLALGFLVMALVTSLGGPTGPALNPARDFGPRLLHAFLPKSVLGEHKGDSKWWYSWVPVVAPIAAAIAAVAVFKFLYL